MTGGPCRGLGRGAPWGGRGAGRDGREADDKEREKPGKWRPVAGAGAGGEPRGGRIGCGRAFMWLDGVPSSINHAGMLLRPAVAVLSSFPPAANPCSGSGF